MNKLISIIVNCFNGEEYLEICLESILNQTYENWEVIFYDNCSIDNSKSIFNKFSSKDNRFKYYKSDYNIPLYHARGEAIKHCKGEYIAFLDVDDIWVNDKLSKQILLFEDMEIGLVVGNFYYLNQRGENIDLNQCNLIFNVLPKGKVISEMFRKYFIHMSSLIIRKTAYDSLSKGFDSRWTILGDFDLCIRLNINWKLDAIDEPTTYYRYHSNNTGKTLGFKYVEEMGQLIQEYQSISIISKLSEFDKFVKRYYWLNFINNIYLSKKISWFETFQKVSSINKLRVIICFFIPNIVLIKIIKKSTSK